jgi:hypothetical protein
MEEEVSTNLTVNDLKTIITIIDACAARGAFRPGEFGPIHELYTKVNTCVQELLQAKQ